MALNFSVADVTNHEAVTTSPVTRGKTEQEWHPVTGALITLSMLCGYNRITDANADTVATRIAQYQLITGACLGAQDMPSIFITREDVRKHIGLSTNATPMSDRKWNDTLARLADRESRSIGSGRRNTLHGPIEIIANHVEISAYDVIEKLHTINTTEDAS